MLEDGVRTRAFRKAIFATCSEKVVLDLGCGSGILSMFAAQAGARRVIAVEGSPRTARLAAEAVRRNGFDGVVSVVCGRVEDEATVREVDRLLFEASQDCDGDDGDAGAAHGGAAAESPKAVDVLVSEWMGYMLVHEDMFGSVAFARDRWLAPEGRMIPGSCSIWAAPFSGVDLAEEVTGFWKNTPYGLDMEHLAAPAMKEMVSTPVIDVLEEQHVLAQPERIWRLTCDTATGQDARVQRVPFAFRLGRRGPLHGLAVWFKCGLATGIGLSTAPNVEPTHWSQTMLYAGPLGAARDAGGGRELVSGLQYSPGDALRGELAWDVTGRRMRLQVRGTLRRSPDDEDGESLAWGGDYDWALEASA